MNIKISNAVIAEGRVLLKDAVLKVGEHVKPGLAKALMEAGHAAEHEVEEAEAPAGKALKPNGPTLKEWVAKGYKPENYPPEGYAARDE